MRCRLARPLTPSACAGGLASPPPAVVASVAATEFRADPREKSKIIQPERSWYVPRTRMLRGTRLAALVNTMDPEPVLDGSRSPVARSVHPGIEPSPFRVRLLLAVGPGFCSELVLLQW